jgi:hypothetical protein
VAVPGVAVVALPEGWFSFVEDSAVVGAVVDDGALLDGVDELIVL